MKKAIVILCIKLYEKIGDAGSWKYYYEILGMYISPASEGPKTPKYNNFFMCKIENILFNYIKKNKGIAKEYHRAVIKKMNENSTDGTYYI